MRIRSASRVVLASGLAMGAPALGQLTGADFDRDGQIDLADYQAFERLREAGHRRADLNRDGAHDLFDTLEFVRQMADPPAGTDTANNSKLYLGIGNHWEAGAVANQAWSVAHDFGPTELNYRWFSQATLDIRRAADYITDTVPPARGRDRAWAEIVPGTPYTYTLFHDGTETGTNAVNSWADQAIIRIDDSFAVDPLKDTGGRFIQLDNETIMFLGWYWGRFMQAKGKSPPTQYSSITQIDEHSTEFLPHGIAFMDRLQAKYTLDDFAWYNTPVARDLRNAISKQPSDPEYAKHHPWNGDAYDYFELPRVSDTDPVVDIGTYPWWSVDEELRGLLQGGDYIDGRLYANNMSDTPSSPSKAQRQSDYFEGQMNRHLAIAADLVQNPPYMARIWIQDDFSDTILVGSAYMERFFTAAANTGVEHAAVDGGRWPFECACELAGQTNGQLWNDLVVRAAHTAGYLPANSGPVDELTLVSATPNVGQPGSQVAVTLLGSDFDATTTVSVSGTGVSVVSTTFNGNPTELDVTLSIAQTAPTGDYDLTVTRGADMWTASGAFEVYTGTAPAQKGFFDSRGDLQEKCVGPRKLPQGSVAVTVTIVGDNFRPGCTVSFQQGQTEVTAGAVTYIDSRRISFPVTVSNAATLGEWPITVTQDGVLVTDWILTVE